MSDQLGIMICEDEVLVSRELMSRVERLGHTVLGRAESAEELLPLAVEFNPDLVLMDINLAGEMNGIHAAEILYRNLRIPSIFTSAYTDRETLSAAIDTYSLGFLAKPIDDFSLNSTIQFGMQLFNRTHHIQGSHQTSLSTCSPSNSKFLEDGRSEEESRLSLARLQYACHLIVESFFPELAKVSQGFQFSLSNSGIPHQTEKELLKLYDQHLLTVREFSRLEHFARPPIDALYDCHIESSLSRILNTSRDIFLKKIRIVRNFSPIPLHSMVDETALQLAFQQVVSNAVIASTEGGIINVATRLEYEELPERFNPNSTPGWKVVIEVKDYGIGMALETFGNELVPCYSTWPLEKRFGLGLPQVFSIMQSLGGWFDIESEPEVGTTVRLYLPQREEEFDS
ncbi:MAG: response regulator [Bdellovibrionales bacterium]|nr:response regulator [Bdellovibrionales bacterium]